MYFVYILKSENSDKYYTGITYDIHRRLEEHNNGQTKSTRHDRPWKLFYFEQVESRLVARKREKYWKSGTGREKRNKLL